MDADNKGASLITRMVAVLVLAVAGLLLLKVVIGIVAGLFWLLMVVAMMFPLVMKTFLGPIRWMLSQLPLASRAFHPNMRFSRGLWSF